MGAGRNRTVLINTPIQFEAESNQVTKKIALKLDYQWSFGDGDSDIGKKVKHIYYFPGEYNVVLTARHKDEISVSRLKVKVIDNVINIASSSPGINGFIELANESTSEVNVNGWEIRSNHREHVISVDTIINPKSSIRIPNRVMNFEPDDEIKLLFPTDEIAYIYSAQSLNAAAPLPLAATQEIIPDSIPEYLEISAVEATTTEEEHTYATTVQAAVVVPERGWWSFVKSLFSIE